LANLKANPEFLFVLKESLSAQLPTRAVSIVDIAYHRRVVNVAETKWYRYKIESVEDLIGGRPIGEVFFRDFTYAG